MEDVKTRALDGFKLLSKRLLADEEDDAFFVEDEDRFEVSFSLSEPLGLELEERAHKLWVRRVIPGGAAAAAGTVLPGDVLEAVGEVRATSMAALEEGMSSERSAGHFSAKISFGRPPETEAALRRKVQRLQILLAEERATNEALRHAVKEEDEDERQERRPDETVAAERDSLRAEIADVRRAAQREKLEAEAAAAQVERSHAAEIARRVRRESELEAAVAEAARRRPDGQPEKEQYAYEEEDRCRVAMLEDELKRARDNLESQRRAASAAVLAAKRSGGDKLEKAKAENAELERRLEEATRTRRDDASSWKEKEEMERGLARAEMSAKAAAKAAMEFRLALDESNAERSALKARLNVAYEKANKAEAELLAEQRKASTTTTNGRDDGRALRRRSKEEVRAMCGVGKNRSLVLWVADAVDDIGFLFASLLRRSFFVRVAVLTYLFLLHAWTAILFLARTFALLSFDNDDPIASTNDNGARLRGSG